MRILPTVAVALVAFSGCSPDISGLTPEKLSRNYVLYDFYADWCGPCRQMQPELEKLQEVYGSKVTIRKVDIDQQKGLAQEKEVDSIPTLILSDGNSDLDRSVGYQTYAQLVAWIHNIDGKNQ